LIQSFLNIQFLIYMRPGIIFLFIAAAFLPACNNDNPSETREEKRAKELSKKNPVIKGRYQCWRILTSGDQVASDLFILSDDLYQVDDVLGHYAYAQENGSMKWIDGPLHQPTENWIGFFTAKGSKTSGGGQTLESMIQVKRQADIDKNNKNVLLQCNCAERE